MPFGLTVPRSASTGPNGSPFAQSRTMLPFLVLTRTVADSCSLSETWRVLVAAPSGASAGRPSLLRRRAGVGRGRADDAKEHHLSGRLGVGLVEVLARGPAPERLVGGEVLENNLAPRGDVREVDDHVGALGRAEQQLLDLHRGGQEAAVVADLPERHIASHPQDQEPRVAAVQEPEPVATPLHLQIWPGGAVDDDRVAEELRVPDRGDVARATAGRVGHKRDPQLRAIESLEEGAAVGIEELARGGEGAVLDHDRDLEIGRVAVARRADRAGFRRPRRRDRPAASRSPPGPHRHWRG